MKGVRKFYWYHIVYLSVVDETKEVHEEGLLCADSYVDAVRILQDNYCLCSIEKLETIGSDILEKDTIDSIAWETEDYTFL
jgi:hypothetical protein